MIATPPVPAVDVRAVPPHDLGAESAVLGAMLLDPEAIPRVVEILDAEHFYAGPNRRLFATIRALFDGGKIPDALTVRSDLERRNAIDDVGGLDALTAHVEAVASSANVESWATIVLDHAVRRRVIATASDLLAAARAGADPTALTDLAQRAVGETEFASAPRVSFATVLDEVFREIDAPVTRRGVPTTYRALDEILGGLQPGSLNLLGARPSMGKTTLALNIAVYVALHGFPTAFLSLEMTENQIVRKALAIVSGVAENRLKGGHILTSEERRLVNDATEALRRAPLFIEYGEFTTSSIRAKLRRLKTQNAVEFAVVDYLGLVKAPPEQRNIRSQIDLVTHVSGALKGTAVSVGLPILALCQLSRANAKANEAAEDAKDIRWPGLTDLRDSGSLEQDADTVLFLHRDGYYTKDRTDTTARVIVAKNRTGETGDVGLTWIPWCQRFSAPDFGASS